MFLPKWSGPRRVLILHALVFIAFSAASQSGPITYQGKLIEAGNAASGSYDLRFLLLDAPAGGSPVAGPVTNSATWVSNGLFTVSLEFGDAVFDGSPLWLELAVRTNGADLFQTLAPRQPITPSPYAIHAAKVSAAGVEGVLGTSQLPPATITNNATGVILGGSFSGNGAGLAGVNASSIEGISASQIWQLHGNGVGPNQFLGSTNEHPLELRSGGRPVLRLHSEPDWGTVRIAGGTFANSASGYGAIVAGGGATNFMGVPRPWHNTADGNFAVVSGGAGNNSTGNWATVSGGRENFAQMDYTTIGGGYANLNNGLSATIGGGAANTNTGSYATIAGGTFNYSSGAESALGGGMNNTASGRSSTIGGGTGNIASGPGSTVAGGGYTGTQYSGNVASGPASAILGGYANKALEEGAVVGGGYGNSSSYYSVVGGGYRNVSTGSFSYATIAGGRDNFAAGTWSAIGGGNANTNTGTSATISGGSQNTLRGDYSAISGGILNVSTGAFAVVSGGALNVAGGTYSSVPGGDNNLAAGANSLAAGHNARATNDGAFVWADRQDSPFASTSSNQFIVRATGGTGINTNNPQATLHVNGSMRVNGLVRAGSEQGAVLKTPGLVHRRVESLFTTAGQVLARTDVLTLERDGTTSGLVVRYPAAAGRQVINAIGMNNTGGLVTFRTVLNSSSSGVVQVFTSAQRIVHAQISIGDTYRDTGRLTQVVLDRTDDGTTDDFYWTGTLTSNFNQ